MPLFHEVVGAAGSQPAVVLLNGIMMTTASWVFQTRALSPHFQVVLHDFRGQLQSPIPGPYDMQQHVDDLVELLDELQIERPHLVGTSYGGEVGMMFAMQHPERVRSLAAIACVSHVEPELRDAVVRWRDAARDAPETLFEISAPYNFSPGLLTPSFLEQGKQRLLGYGPEFARNLADLCDAFLRLDLTDRLHEVRCPTLVLCGENDLLKPPRYSRLIAERIPNATFEMIPGAPHALVLENHAMVNEALLRFLL